jgi:hemerythrin
MPLTEWDKAYELGIQEIDNHHRKLVELLNKAYDLILYSTDRDEIQTILQELIKYTDYHFAAEQQIMKEVEFRGLKTHISKHRNFRKQLSDLMRDSLAGTHFVKNDIVLILWDWLKNHIQKEDKKLMAYF